MIRRLTLLGVVFALYVVAGKAGLALAVVNASASAVWPPTGIALAVLLVLGPALWPAIFLGALVVNLTTAGSVLTSLAIAGGNTLEALIGARLVTRFANGVRAFERPQDVLKFTLVAAMLSTTVSASIGVTALSLGGYAPWNDFPAVWLTWWLGDASGALVVAPTLVLWATASHLSIRRGRLELAAVVALLILVALVTFDGASPLSEQRYPVSFLPFPILVWAAFRFGPRAAATSIAALSAIAIVGTLQRNGPFGALPPNDALLLLQAFVGVATLTTLTLAAAVVDRDRAHELLRAAELRLRLAEERKVAEREEFLSVAAHELKTPMTTLQIAVQSLLRQAEREAGVDRAFLERSLGAIRETTDKLARLVTELLETARVQAGRFELDRQDADLIAIVASAVQRAQARTRKHKLMLSAPAPPVRTSVDTLRLEQVLDNLLDNAIKFSPHGGAIEVALVTAEDMVRITVRDHGVGVPPDRRAQIFERFYQAHQESQRSGLGLGLYVSREIMRLHGGSIAAGFPDDGGTQIVLELPARSGTPLEIPEPVGSPRG